VVSSATIVASDERYVPDDDRRDPDKSPANSGSRPRQKSGRGREGHPLEAEVNHRNRAGEGLRGRCVYRGWLVGREVLPR
jgi:hypothetical protein